MANLVQPPLPETSEEVLYRHVNPKWLDENGEPSGQAFRPFDESNIHLSVDLSSKVSAPDSAKNFKGNSSGVYGVTPKECHSQALKTYWAPVEGNAAHGAIDYTGVGFNNPAKRKASALARMARERKRIHPPLDATATEPAPPAEAAPQAPPQPNDVHSPAEAPPPRGDGNQAPW